MAAPPRTRDRRDAAVHRGNKSAALVAMLTFLEINGCRVEATDRELADWIIAFSRGATPEAIGKISRQRLRPTS